MPYICGSPVMGPDPKMGREGTSMGREVMKGSLALRAVYVRGHGRRSPVAD